MPDTEKSKLIGQLAEAVFAKRPLLKEILERSGHLTLVDHAASFPRSFKDTSPALKEELIAGINRQVSLLWGDSETPAIKQHLESNYFALTGDHHGPIGHPFFLTGNLMAALGTPKYVLVLATSAVSLNNSSQPRGIVYHKNQNQLTRLNLLPSIITTNPVATVRAYTLGDIEHGAPWPSVLKEIVAEPKILNQSRYADQVSLLNSQIWDKIFLNEPAPPKLLSLELEGLVADLLIRHHLAQETPIHKMIFDPAGQELFINNFENVIGSFQDDHGTILFWYIRQYKNQHHRERLRIQNHRFISLDSNFTCEINPAEIKQLLESGRLLPNTILCLLLISAYYGMKCLGGFSQTTYLTEAQTIYNRVFLNGPADKQDHTQTIGADVTAAYLESQGTMVPATALDMILYGHGQSWHNFRQTAQKITLTEAFYPTLPGLYQILYSQPHRQSELSSITVEDIVQSLKLNARIVPIGNL